MKKIRLGEKLGIFRKWLFYDGPPYCFDFKNGYIVLIYEVSRELKQEDSPMFEDIRPKDEYRVDIYGEAAGWPKSKFPELCYRYKDGFKYITIDPQIMNEFKETIKGNEIPKLLETIKSLPQYDGRDFRVDISMSRIRRDIDRACEAGRQYTIIPRTGDNHVDAAICTTMEAEGYKVARNQNKILISWY